jgi:hypothetical protein
MNERSALCSDASVSGNGTDWLTAARARNAGLTGKVQTNTVGHDVGFLSFPFQAEYNMWDLRSTALICGVTKSPRLETPMTVQGALFSDSQMILPRDIIPSWDVRGVGILVIQLISRYECLFPAICLNEFTKWMLHRWSLTT